MSTHHSSSLSLMVDTDSLQPSLMSNDTANRNPASCQMSIQLHVTSRSGSIYVLPTNPRPSNRFLLAHASMKYCGVVTPFEGTRVYASCAMGMPGSESAFEELMCCVLGELQLEGIVTKLADDFYCGANSPEELVRNWTRVLQALRHCRLCLSPSKTVITPRKTTIL